VPNTRSAAKQMRVAERRRVRNRIVKSAVKTYVRKAERTIVAAIDDAQSQVVQAIKSLDKAAAKGILHKSNVARRKSRLMKKFNLAAAADAAPAVVETKPTRSSTAKKTTKPRTRTASAARKR